MSSGRASPRRGVSSGPGPIRWTEEGDSVVVSGWVRTIDEGPPGRHAVALGLPLQRRRPGGQRARRARLGGGRRGRGAARPRRQERAAEAELATEGEIAVEDLAVSARRDHRGLVALPAVRRDARHPAAAVGLGEQRVGARRSSGFSSTSAPLTGEPTATVRLERPCTVASVSPTSTRSTAQYSTSGVYQSTSPSGAVTPTVAMPSSICAHTCRPAQVLPVRRQREARGRGGGGDGDLGHRRERALRPRTERPDEIVTIRQGASSGPSSASVQRSVKVRGAVLRARSPPRPCRGPPRSGGRRAPPRRHRRRLAASTCTPAIWIRRTRGPRTTRRVRGVASPP